MCWCTVHSRRELSCLRAVVEVVPVVAGAHPVVVSHSTYPPLSSSPHAHSFVLGTAVINKQRKDPSTRAPRAPLASRGRHSVSPRPRPAPRVQRTPTGQRCLRYTRGLGWRMHCGVEVTESSTNKQHHLKFECFEDALETQCLCGASDCRLIWGQKKGSYTNEHLRTHKDTRVRARVRTK